VPRPIRWLLLLPALPGMLLGLLGARVAFRIMRRAGNRAGSEQIESAAERALRRGDFGQAAFFARWLVKEEPRAPAGYYLLHRAYLRQGKRAKARAALDAGLRAAPAATPLHLALAAFNERGQSPPGTIAASRRDPFELPGPSPRSPSSPSVRLGRRPGWARSL
jgi:hypothetical protein